VALVEDGGEIEIWGDGEQTRSFCHVDDCVEGIYRLMRSDHGQPLNLGTDRMVTINELARIIIEISGKPGITIRHVDGPQGVRGRNSDNTRLRDALGWEPQISGGRSCRDVPLGRAAGSRRNGRRRTGSNGAASR
jgi:nucleoside-diphosphate-sugar epimerase